MIPTSYAIQRRGAPDHREEIVPENSAFFALVAARGHYRGHNRYHPARMIFLIV